MTTIIRCSSTDRVLACGASLEGGDYRPNNPEANEGRAAHECMPRVITGEGPTVEHCADKYGVDVETLEFLTRRAEKIWGELSRWFPEPQCEVPMSAELAPGVVLRGTADLASAVVAVLDWKFGHLPSTHTGQVKSYSCLLREHGGMPECGYILGVEVWVRAGTYTIHKFGSADLDRHREQLLEQVEHPNQYGPSLHACRYCSRQLDCSARAQWLRSGASALEPVGENKPITRELIADLYDQRRVLGQTLHRYDEILRGMLADGPLHTSDGRHISLEEQERDLIRASKAMRFLREEMRLTPAEADQVLSVSKAGLTSVCQQRAPKRKGAAWTREAMKRLREIGAVEKTTVRKITISK